MKVWKAFLLFAGLTISLDFFISLPFVLLGASSKGFILWGLIASPLFGFAGALCAWLDNIKETEKIKT